MAGKARDIEYCDENGRPRSTDRVPVQEPGDDRQTMTVNSFQLGNLVRVNLNQESKFDILYRLKIKFVLFSVILAFIFKVKSNIVILRPILKK